MRSSRGFISPSFHMSSVPPSSSFLITGLVDSISSWRTCASGETQSLTTTSLSLCKNGFVTCMKMFWLSSPFLPEWRLSILGVVTLRKEKRTMLITMTVRIM